MAARSHRRADSPHLLRAGLACLLTVLSLGGAFGLHHPGEVTLTAGPLSGRALAGACHPELPDHVERPQGDPQPFCPACLQRLQSQGAEVAPATGPGILLAAEGQAADLTLPRLDAHPSLPYSRGPPRA